MITQRGANVCVFGARGNFDDCQNAVKAVFNDPAFGAELHEKWGLKLSSANSINWGRLIPQIAYYLSAYADLVASGAIQAGDTIDVCVPTGNFGNILAAWYARKMGAPFARLLCASNENNVLTDFHQHRRLRHQHAALRDYTVAVDGHTHLVEPGATALRSVR